MRAFLVYDRRTVDYNIPLWSWSSSAIRDTDAVEWVQWRFTKRLPEPRHMSCLELLKHLYIGYYDVYRPC